MFFRLFLILTGLSLTIAAADGAAWRAVAAREGEDVRLILFSGEICQIAGRNIPAELFGKDLKVVGRISNVKKSDPAAMRTVTIQELSEIPPPQPAGQLVPGKSNFYARTDRTLPAEQLLPNAEIDLELPELGNSAASGGQQPIRMSVLLPANYRIDTFHPVIIHFDGGTGNSRGAFHWRSVVGDRNFILVGADYDHAENEKRGTLKIGTCRDFGSAIARHVLQILRNSTTFDQSTVILSGMSSGAYSITDIFRDGKKSGWEPFAGFCAIAGGSKTGGVRLENRSVLFLMGESDTIRHQWLDEAVKGLKGNEKVQVHMVEGVGHEWSGAFTPYILEWLDQDFPNLIAIRQRRAAMEKLSDPEAKAVIQAWIDGSGLE